MKETECAGYYNKHGRPLEQLTRGPTMISLAKNQMIVSVIAAVKRGQVKVKGRVQRLLVDLAYVYHAGSTKCQQGILYVAF